MIYTCKYAYKKEGIRGIFCKAQKDTKANICLYEYYCQEKKMSLLNNLSVDCRLKTKSE